MKFYHFIVCFLLLSTKLIAQEAPNFNTSVSGSQNATASGKEINIPVNYFTGIPNISIPIYSYSRSGIGNNVSLDYFAGGVKIDEQSTSVGLGWQLSTGGVITRDVRGLPDDCPGRGFMFTSEVKPRTSRGGTVTGVFSTANYGKDSIDSELDIFQFNVAGRMGSFVIGKNGKVILIPQQNIKVTWNTGSIDGVTLSSITNFTLIFEDGSRYLFSVPEITIRDKYSDYDAYKPYVSSWYLKSVISPFAEDTINYSYTGFLVGRNIKMPSSRFDHTGDVTINYSSTDNIRINTKYLTQISFPYNVNLNFIYDSVQRVDAPGEYALSRIELRDSVLRMGYKFEYQYFSNKGFTYPYNSTDTGISKLKLYRLSQYTQFQTLNPYEFTYNGYKVPKIGNTSQDHWGYFNNKTNVDLIPALGALTGADREPDSEYVKSGVLTAIKYPDGAKALFEYEANDRHAYFYQESKREIIGAAPDYPQTKTFTVTKYSGVMAEIDCSVQFDSHCPTIYTLKNASNQIIDQFQTGGQAGGTYKSYSLSAGTYIMSCAAVGSCGSLSIGACSINWLNEVQDTSYSLMGGVRVKKITTQDSLNQGGPLIREFKYRNEDNSSSGFAFYKPKYDYIFTVYLRNGDGHNHDYTVRVSSPINNMDYVWGTSVGYTRVEEIMQNNGKVVYEYTSYKDLNYFPAPPQFPFAAKLFPSWELGLVKKKSVVDQANNVLKINENKYKFTIINFSDTAYKSGKFLSNYQSYSNTGGFLGTGYGVEYYYPITGQTVLDSSVEKILSGTDTLLTASSFTYDSLYNLASSKNYLSNDLQKYAQTNIYYPYNYTITGPVKQLRDSGIIVPIAVEKWIKTPTSENLQDVSITGFEVISGTKVKPKYVYKLLSGNPIPLSTIGAFTMSVLNRNTTLIPLQTTIDLFDSKSVPLETTNNLTGSKQSVIWDDEHQTALATVTNAAYGEIAYTSFEGRTNGNWSVPTGVFGYSDAITGKRSFVLNGTISATVAVGKEYLVTYWSKTTALNVNGTPALKLLTYRGWSCYQHILPATTSSISVIGSNITIDELRAYPSSARMTTQTVDLLAGTTSTCGEYNKVTYFEYDDLGRKRLVKDIEGNILEMNCYGPAGQKVNCNIVYKNNEVSRKFIQSNCTGSTTPDTILYTIPAGTYSSTRSQYAADSTAMSDVITNGPAYANANGNCNRIYAKISYENVDLYGTLDVVVRFYANPACTNPKYVNNLVVTVGQNDNCFPGSLGDVVRTVSGTSASIIMNAIYDYGYTECDPSGSPCWNYQCTIDYYLKPGSYIIQ